MQSRLQGGGFAIDEIQDSGVIFQVDMCVSQARPDNITFQVFKRASRFKNCLYFRIIPHRNDFSILNCQGAGKGGGGIEGAYTAVIELSLIHISEPTRLGMISY